MKRIKLIAGIALALTTLAACNTVAGIGQDLQAVGGALSEASDDVRDEFNGPESTSTASANKTCDPGGRELKGRSGLPPC
jgi:entericidin B